MILSKLQKDILFHRLECDGLSETLLDTEGLTFSAASIEEAIASVSMRVASGDWTGLSIAEKHVLLDCIEGGSWEACMSCESHQKKARHSKSCDDLAEQVTTLLGIKAAYGRTPARTPNDYTFMFI